MRRLELTQESFAKYAYWTNSENNASGGTIVFANGDALWGPVWSNDTITHRHRARRFHDNVGTAAPIIVSANFGRSRRGIGSSSQRSTLPSLTALSTLSGLATASGFNFTLANTGDRVDGAQRDRVRRDRSRRHGDSTGANEGFFRVYKANRE